MADDGCTVLPRRRARDEQILPRDRRRSHPVGAAVPRPPCAACRFGRDDALRGFQEQSAAPRLRVAKPGTTLVPPGSTVQELAEKKSWKMSQVALAWIIQKGTIPIVGFSNLARLDESCEVKGKKLTDEEMKYLEELYEPRKVVGHS